jgi:hypothetical protein
MVGGLTSAGILLLPLLYHTGDLTREPLAGRSRQFAIFFYLVDCGLCLAGLLGVMFWKGVHGGVWKGETA